MAEALVSHLVEALASSAIQELHLLRVTKQNIRNLSGNFEDIQAVLADAEKRQIMDQSVRRWVDKLKGVSFEIDAVLDEWNTALTVRSNLKFSGKVFLYSLSCFHPYQVHRVGLRYRINNKIKELKEKLNDLSIEKDRYSLNTQNFSRDISSSIGQWGPKTTSMIGVPKVNGRETEEKMLVRKLLSETESSHGGKGYDIIPIVGTWGIGKTTLAQLVFNDDKVVAHFDFRIWVCVSYSFDAIMVARAILEALNAADASKLVVLDALLSHIKKLIQGKKFFLVLDDVWTDDNRSWEQLESSLRNDVVGNKILVTTRNKRVAEMMRVENHKIITLEILSNQQFCWSIFHQVAFVGKDNSYSKELEDIGWQIAQKSKGLPLVAKTLGNYMRVKTYTSEEWVKVLNSELRELGDQVQKSVFDPLLLSYYNLSPLEKSCFVYCSIFPKDYMINRDELIKLWMSQGFLSVINDYKRGVDCFKNLIARSFFQDFEEDDAGNIIGCKMNDIMHDFLMFLAKNECINTLINSKGEKRELGRDGKAFHCTLILETGAQIPTSIYNEKNLRTLFVRSLGSETTIRWDLLLSLTCLRSLSLHDCKLRRLPKKIDKLIHLRYLSLYQGDGVIKLPETMCNLVNLQSLELIECVVALPKGMGNLVNLRHLYLGHPIALPKELGKLTSLETLDCIKISMDSSDASLIKKVMKLNDLSKLNNLKGRLSIYIGNVKDVEEAERAQLKNKEGLVDLVLDFDCFRNLEPTHKCAMLLKEGLGALGLDFDCFRNQEPPHKCELLLKGLQPHPNLKRLEIRHYYGTTVFPRWMTSLVNLKSLGLEQCYNCENLGPFGRLPSLESLRILLMPKVKKVGLEFLGLDFSTMISFPKLKELEFRRLSSWEEWKLESRASSGLENQKCSWLTIMPHLVSLTIDSCPSLKAPLPSFLRKKSLQNLTIKDCQHIEQHGQERMRTEDFVKILTEETAGF